MGATADPVFAAVTAPGMPFEIAERDGRRVFMHAPATLAAMLEGPRRFGDRTALVETGDGAERRLDYATLYARRDALIARLGIAPDTHVAICMRNRTEWVLAFLAVVAAGGVAVLVNSRGSPAEMAAMIAEGGAALTLTDDSHARLLARSDHAGPVVDLTTLDLDTPVSAPAIHDGTADDPVAIMFTSGTTGQVKGAVLTNRNMVTGLMTIQLSGMMVLHHAAARAGMEVAALLAAMPQSAALLVYPLFHVSGLSSALLTTLLSGGKVVMMRRWAADSALALIAQERISQFAAVPTMLWDVLHAPGLADADLSSLRNIGSGGQALPTELLQAVHAAAPHALIGTGYGMTEASGSVAQAVGEDFMRQPASAGRVLPLVDVRILDDAQQDLPPGRVGEIAVRGAMVMQGYHGRPEETRAVLSADGWLRTGDLGYVDGEGYIFIVDRRKDMVISGGENIYCAEVERVVETMPGVSECAGLSRPDPRLGERLLMVVTGRPDGGGEGVQAWVAERLARYKVPAEVIFRDAPLPRNAMHKIDKPALRRWLDQQD